jgi:2'-5' RNA ligase
MREDAGDLAKIQAQQALTIGTLVKDGFTPESVVKAVMNNDLGLLTHSGLTSVQLLPPGEMINQGNGQPPRPPEAAPPAPATPAVPASSNGNGTGNGKAPAAAGANGSTAGARAMNGYPAGEQDTRPGMISLDLPPGTIDPVPGGITDTHITVVYLGPDLDDAAFAQACARALQAASDAPGPLTGTVGGLGTFPPSGSSDGKKPVYAPVDLPGAAALRAGLEDLSASEHTQWRPHVTLAYAGPDDDLPAPVPDTPVTFTHLAVHRGDDVMRFPLGATLAPSANGRAPAAAH